MNIDDYGVGSVIRIKYAHGSNGPLKLIGVLEGVDLYGRVVLREQAFIQHEIDGKIYYLKNVTVDSADTAKTRIPTNSIICCEYVSFDCMRRENLIENVFDYSDELLKEIKKEISQDKFIPREIRYYTEDGFCIKKKR